MDVDIHSRNSKVKNKAFSFFLEWMLISIQETPRPVSFYSLLLNKWISLLPPSLRNFMVKGSGGMIFFFSKGNEYESTVSKRDSFGETFL